MVDDHDCGFAGKMAGIDKKLTRSLEQEVTSLLVLWMSEYICYLFYDAKMSSCQSDYLRWSVVIQSSSCMMKLGARQSCYWFYHLS